MLSSVSTSLEVRTTFIKDNKDELESIRSISNRFTKSFAINVSVFGAVRGAVSDAKNCRLTPQQIFDLAASHARYYMDNEPIPACNEDMKKSSADVKEYNYDLPPKIITCLGAKSAYWITWDGKMLPCGSFSSPFTTPLTEGFANAWKRLPGLYEDITLPAKCSECEFSGGGCANCPAMLQSETGSFDEVPNYICDITKYRALRKQEYISKI
jgi:radical SAM protein with 4Fe4S-binding SPASM domain